MNFSDIHTVIVDDSEHAFPFLMETAKLMGLDVKGFMCPLEAVSYLKKNSVDLIFTDYRMPGMDGLALIKEARSVHKDVPIVMITGGGEDPGLKSKALALGASDFFMKPFRFGEFNERISFLAMTRQFFKHVKCLSLKDRAFGNHTVRVGHYCRIAARGLNLSEQEQAILFHAAQLHDVGNSGVADDILEKPAKLSTVEMKVVQEHTRIGFDLLQLRANKYLETASLVALTHHECFNGSGYPLRLSGQSIPLCGRIAAVADVFDVLTSHRPYKKAWDFERSLKYLSDNRATRFDPEVVESFHAGIDDVRLVHQELADSWTHGAVGALA